MIAGVPWFRGSSKKRPASLRQAYARTVAHQGRDVKHRVGVQGLEQAGRLDTHRGANSGRVCAWLPIVGYANNRFA